MGILGIIRSNLKLTVSPIDSGWIAYVEDHLDYIYENSIRYDLQPELMYRYKYNLRQFLKEHLMRHCDIEWIVLKINNIPSDLGFSEPRILHVPTDKFIEDLYSHYQTVTKNYNN